MHQGIVYLVYCGILLSISAGKTSGTAVPSTSEDKAEILHDPHDYDEVPIEEMASRPPILPPAPAPSLVPAPNDVMYSEVREQITRASGYVTGH